MFFVVVSKDVMRVMRQRSDNLKWRGGFVYVKILEVKGPRIRHFHYDSDA